MYILNLTDDYEFLNNCTNNENEDIDILIKYLFLSIPSIILLMSF